MKDDTKFSVAKDAVKGLLVFGVALFLLLIVVLSNMGNHRVPAGFAGYAYTNPVFGKNEFVEVMIGPNATGFVWRQKVMQVSITPYTMKETFENQSSILGKDKLSIACKASMVFRADPSKIRAFMENYGGLAQTKSFQADDAADEIMQYAYDNYVKEPFRTVIRTELSKYAALDASSNLQKISDDVLTQVRARLGDTPFLVDSVAVGETTPPAAVVEAVTKKVTASQENERKLIELEIAQKDIAVQRAQGEAEGAKKLEIAKQVAQGEIARGEAAARVILLQAEAEAKGIALKDQALGKNYLQSQMYENMLNNAKVYLPTGSGKQGEGGMPFFGLMHFNETTPTVEQPAQPTEP